MWTKVDSFCHFYVDILYDERLQAHASNCLICVAGKKWRSFATSRRDWGGSWTRQLI